MSNRDHRGRHDYWGCYHDYDVELGELAEKESHEIGTCRGLPMCPHCEERRELTMFELTAEQKQAWRWACRFQDLRCKESDLALALETQLAGKLKAEFLIEHFNCRKARVYDGLIPIGTHWYCCDNDSSQKHDWSESDWLTEARRVLGEE